MALHLLKLIWNRKRTNLLIIAEILLSFIVLAAVSTLGVLLGRVFDGDPVRVLMLGGASLAIGGLFALRVARPRSEAAAATS